MLTGRTKLFVVIALFPVLSGCSTFEHYWNRWQTDLSSVVVDKPGLRRSAKYLMVPLSPRNIDLSFTNARNLTDNLRFELEDRGVRTIPFPAPAEDKPVEFRPGMIEANGADFAITGYVFHVMTGTILEEEDSVGVMVRLIGKDGREKAFVRLIGKTNMDSYGESARAAELIADEIVGVLD